MVLGIILAALNCIMAKHSQILAVTGAERLVPSPLARQSNTEREKVGVFLKQGFHLSRSQWFSNIGEKEAFKPKSTSSGCHQLGNATCRVHAPCLMSYLSSFRRAETETGSHESTLLLLSGLESPRSSSARKLQLCVKPHFRPNLGL